MECSQRKWQLPTMITHSSNRATNTTPGTVRSGLLDTSTRVRGLKARYGLLGSLRQILRASATNTPACVVAGFHWLVGGKGYMPFLFNHLGCIFMSAVLFNGSFIFMNAVPFNGNVENRRAAYLSELLPNV
jgi:hypothetical protein